jgi:AcrR family transcriptional regulator
MRYEKGHKDGTRRRIVEVAARRFRRDGVEAVGVAGLMADAGLTHGGFYSHFASKEDLVRAVVAEAFDATNASLARAARAGPDGLEAIVRAYLDPRHRDRPDRGCAAAALVAEIARHPDSTRAVFADKVAALLGLIAAQLPAGDAAAREARATAIFATMMGSLQLARAATDPARSQRILDGGIAAALALARVATADPAP